MGELGLRHGAEPEAESAFQAALALAVELGMRPVAAHCQLGLATLSRRRGKDDEAVIRADAASAAFGALGMTFWQARAAEVRG
jgi:hypothetical protein